MVVPSGATQFLSIFVGIDRVETPAGSQAAGAGGRKRVGAIFQARDLRARGLFAR